MPSQSAVYLHESVAQKPVSKVAHFLAGGRRNREAQNIFRQR